MEKKPKVLFLSRGDATRSQMAEGILRTLAGDEFEAISAGLEAGPSDPLALEVMNDVGIDIAHEQPKSVTEVLKEHFGHVISIADLTRHRAPIFPFTTQLSSWNIPDPAAATGSREERKRVFRRVRDEIGANVQNFLSEKSEKRPQAPAWTKTPAS